VSHHSCQRAYRLTGSNQLSSKGAAEDQPSDHPEGSKGTNQNKGPPPPVIDRDKGNDEGSDHRSCCGAAVEDTIGQRSIPGRQQTSSDVQSGRPIEGLPNSQHEPKPGKHSGTSGKSG